MHNVETYSCILDYSRDTKLAIYYRFLLINISSESNALICRCEDLQHAAVISEKNNFALFSKKKFSLKKVIILLFWQADTIYIYFFCPKFQTGSHDQKRITSRIGHQYTNAYNMMLLTLPGSVITYQGEELALEDIDPTFEETFDFMGIQAGQVRL